MNLSNSKDLLTDDSPMPFGKHKGEALSDVPASYFHWLWHKGEVKSQPRHALYNYILNNIEAFKKENRDLLWETRT